MTKFLIGVGVGTGSARAGVFDPHGSILAHAKRDVVIFRDDARHVEQSSAQVWQAVCEAVADTVALAAIPIPLARKLAPRWSSWCRKICRKRKPDMLLHLRPLLWRRRSQGPRHGLAGATGVPIEVTSCPEPVLLASAVLGAVAAGVYADLKTAMPGMSNIALRCQPATDSIRAMNNGRYRAFLSLQRVAREIRLDAEAFSE